jgi:Secretion system C-terminal sorting domain
MKPLLLFLLLFAAFRLFSQEIKPLEPWLHPLAITYLNDTAAFDDVISDFQQLSDGRFIYLHGVFEQANPSSNDYDYWVKIADANFQTLDSVNIPAIEPETNLLAQIFVRPNGYYVWGIYYQYPNPIATFSTLHLSKSLELQEVNYFPCPPNWTSFTKAVLNNNGNLVFVGLEPHPPIGPQNDKVFLCEVTPQGEFLQQKEIAIGWGNVGRIAQLPSGKYAISTTGGIAVYDAEFNYLSGLPTSAGVNVGCYAAGSAIVEDSSEAKFFAFTCKNVTVTSQNPLVIVEDHYERVFSYDGTNNPQMLCNIHSPFDKEYDQDNIWYTMAQRDGRVFFGNVYHTSDSLFNTLNAFTVHCINTDGTVNWSHYFLANGRAFPWEFVPLADGGLLVTVEKQKHVFITPQLSQATERDMYYLRFDAAGNLADSVSGISDAPPPPAIRAWPNPASDVVYFSGDFKEADHRVMVFDAQGRLVLGQPLDAQRSLNVGGLPAGLYGYQIHNKNGIVGVGKLAKM